MPHLCPIAIFSCDPVRPTEERRSRASSSTCFAPGSVWGLSHVFHFTPNNPVRQVALGSSFLMRRLRLRHRFICPESYRILSPIQYTNYRKLGGLHKIEQRKKTTGCYCSHFVMVYAYLRKGFQKSLWLHCACWCMCVCLRAGVPNPGQGSPTPRGPIPVNGLLGIRLHNRRWVVGDQAKLHLPLIIAPHHSCYCLNHPPNHPSMEKLSSKKLVPGSKKAGGQGTRAKP